MHTYFCVQLQQTDSGEHSVWLCIDSPKDMRCALGHNSECVQNGAWVLILSMLAVSWICCYKLWEQIRAGRLPKRGGGAKFWANSCQWSGNGRFTLDGFVKCSTYRTSRHLGGLLAFSWGEGPASAEVGCRWAHVEAGLDSGLILGSHTVGMRPQL